jgi:hypothetical protein
VLKIYTISVMSHIFKKLKNLPRLKVFYHLFFRGAHNNIKKVSRDNRVSSFYGIWVVAIRWWKKVNLIAFVSCRYLSPYRINVIQSTDSASALSRFFFFARLLIIICIKPLFARCALSYLFKLTFSVISHQIYPFTHFLEVFFMNDWMSRVS